MYTKEAKKKITTDFCTNVFTADADFQVQCYIYIRLSEWCCSVYITIYLSHWISKLL